MADTASNVEPPRLVAQAVGQEPGTGSSNASVSAAAPSPVPAPPPAAAGAGSSRPMAEAAAIGGVGDGIHSPIGLGGLKDSAAFRLVSWTEPGPSTLAFTLGVALYGAYNLFDYPFPAIGAHLAVTALAYAGLIAFINVFDLKAKIPEPVKSLLLTPQLPADAERTRQFAGAVGERAVNGVNRINNLLRWNRPLESARALAYAWIAARFSYLASPGYLLFFWVLAFLVAPAYRIAGRDVDAIFQQQVTPKLASLKAASNAMGTQAAAVYKKNTLVFPVVVGALVGAFLWIFWDLWSQAGLATSE